MKKIAEEREGRLGKAIGVTDMTRHGHGLMHKAESGAYGEALIRLELSRAGWPLVVSCPGVGIDVLAVAPSGRHRIGISVKCRDRDIKSRYESTFIFREKSNKSAIDEKARFRKVCGLLEAEPWIGVVTITPEFTYLHLISLQHYEDVYETSSKNKAWNNNPKWLKRYATDPEILGIKEPGVRGSWNL